MSGLSVLGVIFGFVGCELLVDTSELDEGCPPETRFCPNAGCVSMNDPAYGCGDVSCGACPLAATNTIVSCEAGECVYTCTRGFGCASCDTFILTDRENCGGCSAECAPGERCSTTCAAGEICCSGTCAAPPCPQ